jgi:molybdopterin-biosynthesis enzyme MoeA-like protein
MSRTAAALIIGNEILTGKIEEKNLAYLGRELFKLGIALQHAVVCRDVIDVIADELNALRPHYDMVFTSGGVGPTHDDMTLPAVARAFGKRLVRAPEVEELIRGYHKERTTEDHLRMADVPEGARLLSNDDVPWPTIAIENVFIFPGVPEIFQIKFGALRPHLSDGTHFVTRAAYTLCDEGEIASMLAEIAYRYPSLFIGSYPRFRNTEYKLKLTVDGSDATEVERALQEIVAALPASKLLRTE